MSQCFIIVVAQKNRAHDCIGGSTGKGRGIRGAHRGASGDLWSTTHSTEYGDVGHEMTESLSGEHRLATPFIGSTCDRRSQGRFRSKSGHCGA
jgi:hypothetical protein